MLELLADRSTLWRRPDGTIWDHDTHETSDTPPPTPAANDQNRIDDDVQQLIFELNEALTAATNRAPP